MRDMDLDRLFNSLPTTTGSIIGVTKYTCVMLNNEKIKQLLNHVEENWNSLTMCEEIEILKSYTETGRLITLSITLFAIAPVMGFLSLPAFGPLLDIIVPLNESRLRELAYPAEYFVDQDNYYHVLLLHELASAFIGLTVVSATDALYIIQIQHICGMFTILSYRLQNITEKRKSLKNKYNLGKEDVGDQQLIRCIQLHLQLTKFVELIESAFTSCLFFDIVIGLFVLSSTCVMVVICIDRLSEAVTYIPVVLGETLRLYFSSWIGQKLIDHSTDVANAVYSTDWYFSSEKTKKLMLQLMIRCRVPCKISVAKLYVMSFDGFSKVMKASLSYCTLMTSIRESSEVQ